MAFWVSSSDFLKVFKPLKPENIFWSTEIFLLSLSELESAKFVPLWLVRFVEVVLVWSPESVILGKNSLLEIFLLCFADSKFFLSAFNCKLFSRAFSI